MKILILFFLTTALFAQNITVKSYYGKYDSTQKSDIHPSKSLSKPLNETWEFSKPSKQYKLAILLPHLKDPYFISVNYGIWKQATKNNILFKTYLAGGYNNIGKQRRQFYQALNEKVDGIILASVSYDKLDKDIEKANSMGIPVVEVINDIKAEKISAKALVSFYDMGYRVGEHLSKISQNEKKNVAFLPGPLNSGWAPETYYGFMDALKKNNKKNIHVYKPLYGDTGEKTQSMLIKRSLLKNKDVDYLIGNAVMALAAPKVLKSFPNKNIEVFSTYMVPQVYGLIQLKKIGAAPADKPAFQAMIAVDMMQKILDGKIAGKDFPFRAGPLIPLVTDKTINKLRYSDLFGERAFKPILSNY